MPRPLRSARDSRRCVPACVVVGVCPTGTGRSPVTTRVAKLPTSLSRMKEPFRVEGKKTMGYEFAEQMNWKLRNGIIYPTGGGVGMIGMWKASDEMEELRWIGAERPKMIAVQAAGCAPIVKAWEAGTS